MIQSRTGFQIWAPLLVVGLSAGIGIGMSGGCTQVRQAEHSIGVGGGVPKSAQKLAAGTGRQGITTTAPRTGTVFINDEDTAEVVYSGKVEAGDPITVDANSGTITVGSFRKDVKLDPKHTYAVYIH